MRGDQRKRITLPATLAWKAMTETLREFVLRRRSELDAETARLQAEIAVLDVEREQVNRVAQMMVESDFAEVTVVAAPLTRDRSPRRASEATIKEMVRSILSSNPAGLTALDILSVINDRMETPYPRTSLSPQLSRLKAEQVIHREGRLWKLGSVALANNEDADMPDNPEEDDIAASSDGVEEEHEAHKASADHSAEAS